MATLNKIADDILGTLDRPNDVQFKERIKYVFINELASVLRQEINKRQISDDMKQTYVAPIELILNGDLPNEVDSTDIVYRTTNPVSKPVRYNTDDPFVSVKFISTNKHYIYIKNVSEYLYRASFDLNRFNSDGVPIYYSYRNGYIYLHNLENTPYYDSETEDLDTRDKFIVIIGVHNVFDFLNSITIEADTYNLGEGDDVELPIADDIIQLIKIKLLSSDFALVDNRDKVIPTHIDNN